MHILGPYGDGAVLAEAHVLQGAANLQGIGRPKGDHAIVLLVRALNARGYDRTKEGVPVVPRAANDIGQGIALEEVHDDVVHVRVRVHLRERLDRAGGEELLEREHVGEDKRDAMGGIAQYRAEDRPGLVDVQTAPAVMRRGVRRSCRSVGVRLLAPLRILTPTPAPAARRTERGDPACRIGAGHRPCGGGSHRRARRTASRSCRRVHVLVQDLPGGTVVAVDGIAEIEEEHSLEALLSQVSRKLLLRADDMQRLIAEVVTGIGRATHPTCHYEVRVQTVLRGEERPLVAAHPHAPLSSTHPPLASPTTGSRSCRVCPSPRSGMVRAPVASAMPACRPADGRLPGLLAASRPRFGWLSSYRAKRAHGR